MESSALGYIISANIKQQGRRLPWRLGHIGGGIQSKWKPPLSRIGPHTKVSLSHGGESDSCRLYIHSRMRIPYIQVLCVGSSSTLWVSLFLIWCSLTLSHTSTDPQFMTSQSDNKKARERLWDGSFILLMRGLSEQSLFTKRDASTVSAS